MTLRAGLCVCCTVDLRCRATRLRVAFTRAAGLFLLVMVGGPALGASMPAESRAIFDGRYHWLTREGADTMLDRIEAAGFNVLVPAVWKGAGTTWPSKRAPRDPAWEKVWSSDFPDPLAYLIEQAHGRGIEVHPWFTISLRRRSFLKQFYDEGTPERTFNLHIPEFRRYMIDTMLEVVRAYDVDGINIDYIRTSGICTSSLCAASYRAKTGGDIFKDSKRYKKNEAVWERIAGWNAGPVNEILTELYAAAKSLRPDLIISADSHPGDRGFALQGADSISWANEGSVDVIMAMSYQQPENLRWEELNSALARVRDPRKFMLLIGNFERHDVAGKTVDVWSRDPAMLARLVKIARDITSENNGIAMFHYDDLSDEQIEGLRNGPFKEQATPYWAVTGSP